MKLLLRLITTLETFWKLRHLFSKYTYAKSGTTYKNIFKKIANINTIIDFGCANGEKLDFFIEKKKTKYIYGIDINHKVLENNKIKFLKKKIVYFRFDKYLTNKNLKIFLLLSQSKKIDLIIFSRVLYLLNDTNFNKIMSIAKHNCKYILIDDFFLNGRKKVFRDFFYLYKSTNFSKILNSLFYLEYFGDSPHKKNINLPNPKIALYRRKNIY